MSRLRDGLDAGEFLVTCELNPPKGTRVGPLLDKAEGLRGRVHAFNLTDSHASLMAMSPVAVAHLLRDRDLEPVLQITTRDRNRIALQADLLAASALGVENIVVMGGDPPANGDHPDAKPVFDLYASAVLEAARGLESGHDLAGNALDGAPRFCLGAVVNPGAADPGAELTRMEEKLQAGARFFQTQAVYDVSAFEAFVRRAETLGAVLLAGIIPLKSPAMAAWMNEHVPGITVPEPLVEAITRSPDRTATAIETAIGIIREVRPMCDGLHVMPVGWEDRVAAILDGAGLPQVD